MIPGVADRGMLMVWDVLLSVKRIHCKDLDVPESFGSKCGVFGVFSFSF